MQANLEAITLRRLQLKEKLKYRSPAKRRGGGGSRDVDIA
jgi:hypothetical protein